ncbi:flagellar hook-associated protein FlgL [Cohnella sp. AR92]|uniref:flagellar hook-associated protein FlgL n=1 Tax=Cohnella sp. AR92 TaxID=648716 RepID=UPI000F8D66EB|nr:flagellar hook-associated protein FlgL [Cohnella sp. AR92]RUS42591.1 flagellar hook-associated protein FlgL [Cohnella sp. AR92]
MVARITQGAITSQLLRNLNNNLNRSSKIEEQLSTGMKINKPSDDPVGITYSLRYRSDLSVNERYKSNVDSAVSWLDYNDTLLSQVNDVLKRVKELAVQGSNGTNPDVSLDNIALEMNQLKGQLVEIGNSTFNGKYVFNGQFTGDIPYPDSNKAIETVTDSGTIDYVIGAGIKLPVNLSGNAVFGYPPNSVDKSVVKSPVYEDDNIFNVLDQMITNLQSGTGVANQISLLESRMDKILTQQADIGARTNRVELMQSRLADLNMNLQSLQAKTEDVDYDDLIIKSKVNDNVYQASLSVGSKIIQPTLVDFLN